VGIGDLENASATPQDKDMKIADAFPWGKQWPPPDDAGNHFGEECNTAAGLAELNALGYRWNLSFIKEFNDGKVITAAAGSFPPNGLGIYDLGGNVWEWCEDQDGANSASRVLRGGSWQDGERDVVLSSNRNSLVPTTRYVTIGFRAVVEAS
jgi:formylglycine-generating enzyme required for sulfatase activity